MEKEFVTYTQALRLKALGFNDPCFSFYMGGFKELGKIKYVNPSNVAETNVLAPTFSQAFRWFRDKYGFHVRFLEPYNNLSTPNDKWRSSIHNMNKLFKGYTNGKYIVSDSYEELESACLDKLIEIIESE